MAFINRASVTVNLPRQVRRQTRRHINCAISECGFCNLWNPGSKAQTDWFKPSDRLQFESVIACGDSCGCSSVGRAPRCQRGCRGFESLHPLFLLTSGCVEAALVRKLPQQQSPCSRSTFTLDLNWRAAVCDCFLSVAQSALQNCRESCVPRELCRVFDASNAFYAFRTESGTPANYSQVAQSFAPGAVAVHARICYDAKK